MEGIEDTKAPNTLTSREKGSKSASSRTANCPLEMREEFSNVEKLNCFLTATEVVSHEGNSLSERDFLNQFKTFETVGFSGKFGAKVASHKSK